MGIGRPREERREGGRRALLQELGFSPPTQDEVAAALGEATSPLPSAGEIPANVLRRSPRISYSSILQTAPLGLASIAGNAIRGREVWFLLSPTWSRQSEEAGEETRREAIRHRLACPGHHLIFICNEPSEVEIFRRHKEAAFLYNKTANLPERTFRPLPGTVVEFDAVYNARLAAWKRHELSLGIERCAFTYYRTSAADGSSAAKEAEIIARHRAEAPGHVFINPTGPDGAPVRLSQYEVNAVLNRAAVGLCLSEVEGAMYASTEYLLAGLPVVSTPSRGGRALYYDDEYCLTVPPDVRSVAEAVEALKARRIPRDYVRQKTLKRMESDRSRFLALLNEIVGAERGRQRFEMPWPFQAMLLMDWLPPAEATMRLIHGLVDTGRQRPSRYYARRMWLRRLTGL